MVRGDTAAEDGQIEDATAASKGLIDCFQVGASERERERDTVTLCVSVCVCVCVFVSVHVRMRNPRLTFVRRLWQKHSLKS